jgi:hypothetical protein
VPFWCLLFGAYLSFSYWTWTKVATGGAFTEPGEAALRRSLTFAVASVTLAASNVLTRLVSSYGFCDSALPITNLTGTSRGWYFSRRPRAHPARVQRRDLGVLTSSASPASQSRRAAGPLESLLAGMFVTLAGQIRIGDYQTRRRGYVIDFNWRSTRLRCPAATSWIVPNAMSQAM